MAPISAILQSMDDWLILASSDLVTSVSRRGIRSLPFMARPPPDGSTISCDYSRIFCQPHLLQRPSGIVSWATYRPLVFLVPDGMFRMRLLQPCLQDQWDFLDDQFQVSQFPLCREFSSLVDSSGPAVWRSILLFSSPRSQLIIRRFGCELQALIGEHHTKGLSSPHQKTLSKA